MNSINSKKYLAYKDKTKEELNSEQLFLLGVLYNDFNLIKKSIYKDIEKKLKYINNIEDFISPKIKNLFNKIRGEDEFCNFSFENIISYYNDPKIIEDYLFSNEEIYHSFNNQNCKTIIGLSLLYDNEDLFTIGSFIAHKDYLKNLSRYRNLSIKEKFKTFKNNNDLHLNVLKSKLPENITKTALEFNIYPGNIINNKIIPSLKNHKKKNSFINGYLFEILAIHHDQKQDLKLLLEENKIENILGKLQKISLFFIKQKNIEDWGKTEAVLKNYRSQFDTKPLIITNLEEIENQEVTEFILSQDKYRKEIKNYIENNHMIVKCNAALLDFYLKNTEVDNRKITNISRYIAKEITKNTVKKKKHIFETLKILNENHPDIFKEMMTHPHSIDNLMKENYKEDIDYWETIKLSHLKQKNKKTKQIL